MAHYTSYNELDLRNISKKILAQWQQEKTFAKSLQQRKKSTPIHFYEGPPGANGLPGIHHILSRTLKDIFCRYQTMQGHLVERKSGWDTHGLPVELAVERQLNITKEDIGKTISITKYNSACKKAVLRYQKEWEAITRRIGYWIDLENPYITCDSHYISTLWSLLKKLHQKGYLYKGHSIQPYSPAAGTGLSTHELNQPGCYREVKDTSIVAQFAMTHVPNTYLLAWTTTPWTLPANSALAINAHLTYVKVKTYNPYTLAPIYVILAQAALHRFFDKDQQNKPLTPAARNAPLPWKIVSHGQGNALLGHRYHQLMPYIPASNNALRIIHADFVSHKDGTGIVHIAPTFGSDDATVAQKHNIPPITVTDQTGKPQPIVDQQGRFVKEITDFAGRYVKQAYEPNEQQKPQLPVDIEIANLLKKSNKAFHVSTHFHSYPHCWRTDKPILYYPLDAWFIKTTACKDRLIHLNNHIHWQPSSTGKGRFGDWLKNLVDWNITRDRFWGTPLPIWRTQDTTEEKCIGSLKELQQEIDKAILAGFMKKQIPDTFDLHRPYVDDIILVSPTGQKMFREKDVVDVWFDSGAMPYAQHNPPPSNLDTPPKQFPADFIIEGIDQTRGWFFTLHALAVMLYDQPAYKRVLSTGLVLDRKGQKMSKRLGNVIDPNKLLDKHGPDVLRWYMISHSDPWENLKFDTEALHEVQRKFFGTIYNTYQFFALYANLDNFKADDTPPKPTTQSDRWILSKLQQLIATVTQSLNQLSPTPACRALQEFVINDLSNWYVRLNRKRFWRSGYDQDKKAAYQTLHHCLITITQLSAPIAPFYMDHLYRDLTNNPNTSVHLINFPIPNTQYITTPLEKAMHYAQTISSLVHRLRKKNNIKVRQPLQRILIPTTNTLQKKHIEQVTPLILAETNVKQLEFVQATQGMVRKRVKPNYPHLGKTHGPQLKAIATALANLSQQAIATLEATQHIDLALDAQTVSLSLKDLIIITEDMPGWAMTTENNLTIALDLKRTPALISEGIARELVNRIQNLRKDKQLAIDDKIQLTLATDDWALRTAFDTHQTYITTEVQAKSIRWEKVDHLFITTPIILEQGTLHVVLEKLQS